MLWGFPALHLHTVFLWGNPSNVCLLQVLSDFQSLGTHPQRARRCCGVKTGWLISVDSKVLVPATWCGCQKRDGEKFKGLGHPRAPDPRKQTQNFNKIPEVSCVFCHLQSTDSRPWLSNSTVDPNHLDFSPCSILL